MKIPFYKSMTLFSINQQLTIIHVIPLKKCKILKFTSEDIDNFL